MPIISVEIMKITDERESVIQGVVMRWSNSEV